MVSEHIYGKMEKLTLVIWFKILWMESVECNGQMENAMKDNS